jgi:hypothetical protein
MNCLGAKSATLSAKAKPFLLGAGQARLGRKAVILRKRCNKEGIEIPMNFIIGYYSIAFSVEIETVRVG